MNVDFILNAGGGVGKEAMLHALIDRSRLGFCSSTTVVVIESETFSPTIYSVDVRKQQPLLSVMFFDKEKATDIDLMELSQKSNIVVFAHEAHFFNGAQVLRQLKDIVSSVWIPCLPGAYGTGKAIGSAQQVCDIEGIPRAIIKFVRTYLGDAGASSKTLSYHYEFEEVVDFARQHGLTLHDDVLLDHLHLQATAHAPQFAKDHLEEVEISRSKLMPNVEFQQLMARSGLVAHCQ